MQNAQSLDFTFQPCYSKNDLLNTVSPLGWPFFMDTSYIIDIALLLSNLLSFLGGFAFKWLHNLSQARSDVVSNLVTDNKAYAALVASLQTKDDMQQKELEELRKEIETMKSEVATCKLITEHPSYRKEENIITNPNPSGSTMFEGVA